MKFKNSKSKQIVSFVLVLLLLCGTVPTELWSYIDLSAISSAITALAARTEDGSDTDYSSDTDYVAPDCSFTSELYVNATDADTDSDYAAIPALPTYEEYVEEYGYYNEKALHYTLSDLTSICGTGTSFGKTTATAYVNEYSAYTLMISTAQELYDYSKLANSSNTDEKEFYLSLNIVLGNNIEFSDLTSEGNYELLPIGSANYPFTGTFDGQGFEIRDLIISTSDGSNPYKSLFGRVGESAEISNFGVCHVTINDTNTTVDYLAGIASWNNGYIHDVYAIIDEYDDSDNTTGYIYAELVSAAGGLVAYNDSNGKLENSYFAGKIIVHDTNNIAYEDPVCAVNDGTVSNCYYDSTIYALGYVTTVNDWGEGTVTGLDNLSMKQMNGMEGTSFKIIRANPSNKTFSSTTASHYSYPRLYGFSGTGTEDDPFVISTPAQLVYFPTSAEYANQNSIYYFKLGNDIDMNEIAENAYVPQMDFTFTTNNASGTLIDNGTFKGYSFRGKFDGTADDSHINGSYSIINLTIDTPATSANDASYNLEYAAFIARTYSDSNSQITSISNVNFIGGKISTGDTNCAPTANTANYYTKVATVVADSTYVSMTNVHSSATVSLGSGTQRSAALGGLVADGSFGAITDCTFSGSVGTVETDCGYVYLGKDSNGNYFTGVHFKVGGLLGDCSAGDAATGYKFGKITHSANYGNVYAIQVISPEKESVTLSSSSTGYAAGITTSNVGSSSSSVTDANRGDKIANFGNIYDGPIQLDENGDPVYEEVTLQKNEGTFKDSEGNLSAATTITQSRPAAEELPEGYEITGNNNWYYSTALYGIGYNYVCNAANYGEIHAVMAATVYAYGCGYMGANNISISNLTVSGNYFYNRCCYNEGDIYIWQDAGARRVSGISGCSATESYSSGDIYFYGTICTVELGYYYSNDPCGYIAGISTTYSAGCYFDGTIYYAPTDRQHWDKSMSTTGLTLASYAFLSGITVGYGTRRLQTTVNGETTNIDSVNNGTIIVDLNMNDFKTSDNTGATTIWMYGTGGGAYSSNYGTFDFIPNYNDTAQSTKLELGVYATGINSTSKNYYNTNYTDLEVDFTGYYDANTYIKWLSLHTGIYCMTTSTFSGGINYGDISFDGKVGTLQIAKLYYQSGTLQMQTEKTTNNTNYGNVSVGQSEPESTNISTLTIYGVYSAQSNGAKYNIINYGDTYISGTFGSCTIYNTQLQGTASNGVTDGTTNYGDITLYNLYCTGAINVYAVGYGYYTRSANYGKITVHDVYSTSTANYISGGLGGKNNVNYGDIEVYNVAHTANNNYTFYIGGVNANTGTTATNCENYGNISVHNMRDYLTESGGTDSTLTILGTEYENTNANKTATVYVAGISPYHSVTSCINFGDIDVSNAYNVYVGGVGNGSISNSYNYGTINVAESGGKLYIGGIYGGGSNAVTGCMNFGAVTVTNPTSYTAGDSTRYKDIGGICGYCSSSTYNCSNYAPITYMDNDGNNAVDAYVGGVIGERNNGGNRVHSVLNYGDIIYTNYSDTPNICIGGITGKMSNGGYGADNAINYGNITVNEYGTSRNTYVGGTVAHGTASYTINYGTITNTNEATTRNLYIGTIGGYAYVDYYSGRNIDLSDQSDYPIYGTKSSGSAVLVSYTLNSDTAAATTIGATYLVTYDKTNPTDGDTTLGVYSADFFLRSEYAQEIDYNYTDYSNIHLIYQDYDLLSPYLQAYLTAKFGDVAKDYGAYVVLTYNSGSSTYTAVNSTRLNNNIYPSGGVGVGVSISSDDDAENYTKYTIPEVDEDDTDTDQISVTDTALNTEVSTYCDYTLSDTTVYSLYNTLLDNASDYLEYGDGGDYLTLTDKYRTLYTDYYIFAQQCSASSLTEVEYLLLRTKYEYYNTDSLEYQTFGTYYEMVETHPACTTESGDTELSDTVLYTDINIYIAIDQLSSIYRVEQTDEDGNTLYDLYDTDTLYLMLSSSDIENALGSWINYTDDSTVLYYVDPNYDTDGTSMTSTSKDDYTADDNTCSKTDTYWLFYDNLADALAEDCWSEEAHDWGLAIPYDDEDADRDGTVYSQVLAVQTAEDGVHQNIIVVHVILDYFDPVAELTSVRLQTPDDNSVTSTTTNYVDEDDDDNSGANGLITEEEEKPSVTDETTSLDSEGNTVTETKTDVTYYYLNDGEDADDTDLDGENIQEFDYISSSTSTNNPTLTLNTENMDTDDDIYYKVYWMPLIPEEGYTYNSLSGYWETVMGEDGILSQEEMEEYGVEKTYSSNSYAPDSDEEAEDDFDETTYFSGTTHPTDVEYDDTLHSTGTATIVLNGCYAATETSTSSSYSTMYYGGYYMVELYYERTKNAGTDGAKHFATLFIEKENSPQNTLNTYSLTNGSTSYAIASYVGPNTNNYSANTIYSQNVYDSQVDADSSTGNTVRTSNVTPYNVYYNTAGHFKDLGIYFWMSTVFSVYYDFSWLREYNDYTGTTALYHSVYYLANTNAYGHSFARKAYIAIYENLREYASTYYSDVEFPSEYTLSYLSPAGDTFKVTEETTELDNYASQINIYYDEDTGLYYPLEYDGIIDVMAENGDVRTYTTQLIMNGDPDYNHSYTSEDGQYSGTYSNDPTVSITSVTDENGYAVNKSSSGEYHGAVGTTVSESSNTFTVAWTADSSRVQCMNSASISNVKVYFTEYGSTEEKELSSEEISAYLTMKLSSAGTTSNTWTFALTDDAPVGTYRIVPYATYTDTYTQSEAITLNYTHDTLDEDSNVVTEYDDEGNITSQAITYTIPYTSFYIDNAPNDDSYISSFNVAADITTPFIEESTDFDGSDDRDVSIIATTSAVSYTGYDYVRTDGASDVNVDAFTIYAYTAKNTTSDTVTMTLPYKASLCVWVQSDDGEETITNQDGNTEKGDWVLVNASTEVDAAFDDAHFESISTTGNISTYTFNVAYSETDAYVGYYKVMAEDDTNCTVYTLNVSPSVRNQEITLEVAHSDEAENITDSTLKALFETSGELYDEIIAANGYITATIKEIGSSGVDAYQTKILDADTVPTYDGDDTPIPSDYTTQPYVYNLKAYRYDISVDLPTGYEYMVILMSDDYSTYTVLADSSSYDGKSLSISIANSKSIDIRIIITRTSSSELWGVEHFWTFYNANIVDGYIQNTGGGYFYNYVKDRDK